jgi:hypothetical protein
MKILLNSIWNNRNSLFFIILAFTIVALLLPASVLPDIRTRSLYHLWESGHLLVFFLGCHFFYLFCPRFSYLTFARQMVFLLCIAPICVIAIEGLQSFISGNFLEFSDIVGDMAGVLLFLSIRTGRNGNSNYLLLGATVSSIGFVLWPVLCSFTDEMLARHQFPLLADFETPFEASRFAGKTGNASISEEKAFHGKHSLKLSFFPGPWSGMMLHHFPSNWLGYTQLQCAVYNPNPQQVSCCVRIHDARHEEDNRPYSDLYSQIISLPAGVWTEVVIPLNTIKNAPQSRQMDLENIDGLGFFVEEEKKPLMLYLDTIRLD